MLRKRIKLLTLPSTKVQGFLATATRAFRVAIPTLAGLFTLRECPSRIAISKAHTLRVLRKQRFSAFNLIPSLVKVIEYSIAYFGKRCKPYRASPSTSPALKSGVLTARFINCLLIVLAIAGVCALAGCDVSDPLVEDIYITDIYGGDAYFTSVTIGGVPVVPGGVAAHNLLSATHTDTTVGAVARGDLITGQGVAPKWIKLAVGGAGTFLSSDGTDASWRALLAADIPALSGTYVPYAGATGNIDLNAKEVTNGTLNAMVGKGTWTASGTWKLPAMYFNGDITTDRWQSQNSNTFFGVDIAGADNLALGGGAEGTYNTAIGYYALHDITTSYFNTAVGAHALENVTTGVYNTAVGQLALGDVNTGEFNTAVGMQALRGNTGSYNTALGLFAGGDNIVGSSNVFLGASAGKSELGSNKLYIDVVDTATPLIYGDFSTNELTINGALKMGTNKVFFSEHSLYSANTTYLALRDETGTGNAGLDLWGIQFISHISAGATTVYFNARDADTGVMLIRARDTGVGLAEIARLQGAADPYIQLGRSDTGVATNAVTDSIYLQAGAGANNIAANFGLGVPIYLSSDLHVLAKRASLNWIVTNPTAATYATRLDIGLMAGGTLTTPLEIYGSGGIMMPQATTEPVSTADRAGIYAIDLSPANCTIGFDTETAVLAAVGIASTHKMPIRWNGVTYYLLVTNVP